MDVRVFVGVYFVYLTFCVCIWFDRDTKIIISSQSVVFLTSKRSSEGTVRERRLDEEE